MERKERQRSRKGRVEVRNFKVQSKHKFYIKYHLYYFKILFLMADGKNKSPVSYFCSSHNFSLDRSNVTPSEIFHEYITYTSIYIFTLSPM